VTAAAVAAAVAEAMATEVVAASSVAGGDVARAYRVELADGRTVFAKTHDHPPPGFFVTEAIGLRWLGEAEAVRVPEVLAVRDGGGAGGAGTAALLVLEWIAEGSPRPTTEEDFGRALAGLHRRGAPCFGRTDRRPTGSRSLPNDPAATWAEFYAARRLRPLVALARHSRALDEGVLAAIERVADHLDEIGAADEPPARLHGDLWAGNRLVDRHGVSWLIDPAAHGGHREFDLGMMRLFGGFGAAAFAAYEEVFPLAEGWPARVPVHQLAPLIVHAVKFGGGYRAATARAVAAIAVSSA